MRLIDADRLVNDLRLNAEYLHGSNASPTTWEDVYSEMADYVEDEPTVEVAPLRRGRWSKDKVLFLTILECSACGTEKLGRETAYCSCCGAKMEG